MDGDESKHFLGESRRQQMSSRGRMEHPRASFREKTSRYASPREWAVDANDGVIATAGLLEGFAGAGAADRTLMTAAVAMIVAGSLSLGGSKWAEARGELDAEHLLIEEEIAELTSDPEREVAELEDYWMRKGLSPELAKRVAEELSAHDALAAQLEYEHHIETPTPPWHPLWVGVTSGIAFLVGSFIPLLISFTVPVRLEVWAILVAVTVSLVFVSIFAARTGHMSIGRTIMRTLGVAIATMGLSYAVGSFFF